MDVQLSISSQVLFGSILLFGTVRHFAENLLLVKIVAGYHCKFHQKSDMQLKHCLTMRDEQCEHHCHKLIKRKMKFTYGEGLTFKLI